MSSTSTQSSPRSLYQAQNTAGHEASHIEFPYDNSRGTQTLICSGLTDETVTLVSYKNAKAPGTFSSHILQNHLLYLNMFYGDVELQS